MPWEGRFGREHCCGPCALVRKTLTGLLLPKYGIWQVSSHMVSPWISRGLFFVTWQSWNLTGPKSPLNWWVLLSHFAVQHFLHQKGLCWCASAWWSRRAATRLAPGNSINTISMAMEISLRLCKKLIWYLMTWSENSRSLGFHLDLSKSTAGHCPTFDVITKLGLWTTCGRHDDGSHYTCNMAVIAKRVCHVAAICSYGLRQFTCPNCSNPWYEAETPDQWELSSSVSSNLTASSSARFYFAILERTSCALGTRQILAHSGIDVPHSFLSQT